MAFLFEVAGIILCWEFLRWVLAALMCRRTGAPVALDSNSPVQQQLLYLEEEAEMKRQRHIKEMEQLLEEREQKRQKHKKELQKKEKELAEVSARSAQKVEESYFARLAGVAKALANGLIDQAEHDRMVQAIRPKRADAITIYEYVTKTLRGDAKRVAAVEREMKRLVESGAYPKPAADRDSLGRILYFSGPDGPKITEIYQKEVDKHNGVSQGQRRLM